jgi:hypothetical protein
MIHLHDAIYALNSSIVRINNDVAYDENNNPIAYDKSAAEAKLAELQNAETAKEQAAVNAKASAQAKLATLGLTPAEVTAIIGN